MTATMPATTGTGSADAPVPAPRGLGWLYVVGGLIGLAASFALVLEKLAKLGNPDYVPTCSLNPIISCGSVMDSPQAALFGFPNPLLGVASFPIMVVFGAALLAGFTAPRWFWAGAQLGTTLGLVFVHWLIFQSLYEIGALCPYCMVVWAVTIPMFWYTTLHNLRPGRVGEALARVHSVVLTVWYLTIVVLCLQAFWDYWTTLL
ncbi:vitamin K epoxide reductase family protein [Saccharopolyspora erythraea]|uniref:vitamin K epoxide reductase family protein n=1 Tax=Saccharopolyspora erythraea TaxID=1836 RepID=UPI001BA8BEF4|nr:vitamin K epoxide reductase family protein [Saccharopolyspora erythraea]QUH00737.1 vitamin K epoxide reductase family protein [Saccharopolyspora erythraea]